MNCDICHTKKATIFFSQMVESKLQKVNLCKNCADDKGVTDPTGFALADMLEGMGEQTCLETSGPKDELICGSCGFSQTDFKKTGRFGCADCYHVFDEGLDGLLEAMHKHTQHVGKAPANFPDLPEVVTNSFVAPPMEPSPFDRLSELKQALSKSVEDEDYEEAARLRDAISQLETQLSDS
ncbi:MAG: UvrB/UvrC motif-containing protein [Verrucomicrobiales bacterium]|jgi:protein arginine kinase activator|nr:UvrB/UvrC motif-containing protein [Verrucomicrobiales bacterium]MBP9225753.1 UvrB/UvrC motif-containing protein [Verrucomicrobiales bacterium]HQZ27706.1 UvrB/UvrC motif-containing protein [Verrucomicrobiales bacterium]